jgi:uncharacterized protein involved in outer membrane biogenesis
MAESSTRPMPEEAPRRRAKARYLLAVVVLALLGLLVPPLITLRSFSTRISNAMERALGRRVTVGEVTLRLLPRPGFELQKLVIFDDPAFGAEPMLRADKVTADLRISSLWGARLEVARLSLKSGSDINAPSLNLVRAPDGRWNIEALLQRASQTPTAPTAQTHSEARARFPYIEVNGGRINFKIGTEKKVYALTDSDFALWLAAENEWAFRLIAHPVRTDFNLTDTGVLKVNGRFGRASSLRETPLEVNATLQNAQLGQLTKLIYGRDRGWRGSVDGDLRLAGTPVGLKITTRTAIRDFRRYDINTTEPAHLEARCTAEYSSITRQLANVDCRLPLARGVVSARGSITRLVPPRAYDVSFSAEQVGLQAAVSLARHAKKDIPADLTATGTLDGSLRLRKGEDDPLPLWTGELATSETTLRSSVLASELSLQPITFRMEGPGAETRKATGRKPKAIREAQRWAAGLYPGARLDRVRLVMAPAQVPLGGSNPAEFTAWFGPEHFTLALRGEARVARLLQAARALGLRALNANPEGSARLDLRIAGSWPGFAAPAITGKAQLRNVVAALGGVNSSLQISSADVLLAADAAIFHNLRVRFDGLSSQISGSLRIARNCETLEQCPIQFDLQADELSTDALNQLLNPRLARRQWYEVFGGRPASPVPARIRASGRIRAARVIAGSLVASAFSADVRLVSGKLLLSSVRAEVLGGRHEGEWHADFTGPQPRYSGTGTFAAIAMSQVSTLMHDGWAEGSAGATYKVDLSGYSTPELANSAEGFVIFAWRNGALRHLNLEESSGPLRFRTFTGQMKLREGVLSLAECKINTANSIYLASGTATLARQLNLRLTSGRHAYRISGPLENPKVASTVGQQAALKP